MDFAEVSKTIQIIFILSPFFFSVFFLVVLIKKGIKYLKRYTWFWLIFAVLLTGLTVWALFTDRKGLAIYNLINATGSTWATYESMRKKKSPTIKSTK